MNAEAAFPALALDAEFNYLADSESRPWIRVPDEGEGEVLRNAEYRLARFPVGNLRELVPAATLDVHGFELRTAPSAVADWSSDAAVERTYYAELDRLLKQATGAREVRIFDHTRRVDDASAGGRKPVRTVHNDYTERSGPQRVRDLVDAPEADQRLGRRFAIVNAWRSTLGVVRSAPLAVTDARSVHAGDFVATDLVYPDRIGEIYDVRHSPSHRWYYAPEMTPDEVLLLKTFDSATDGRARYVAHSAFDLPGAAAARRESIEARALLFF